ncbi:MAG TPA: flagellar basal body P-ring protein FlgI [Alphaproteobacteria bacterium]|nr:flagellar basal body P-ring protein FlgI [Alphaproteobacteria bacterium]
MPLTALLPALRRIALIGLVAAAGLAAAPAAAQTRIKDIVDVEGVRDNLLVGYGLAVGLNGTGDSLTSSPFTEQSLIGMLERLGVNTRDNNPKTKNVAAVMVTATLPPFATQGSRIDITVSALGDAKSLQGGTLLVTPLLGADGEVYAVAQGNVAVGGFKAEGAAASVTKGVPTSGRIANGAIVEREIPFQLAQLDSVRLALRNPDFTTARRIAQAINASLQQPAAAATDPSTVRVTVPPGRRQDIIGLITDIEQLRVVPDQIARVVIDEQTGVIVMGENVRISTVAIAQGNLTIRITETPQVSQPNALSTGGQTVVVPRTDVQVDEGGDRRLAILSQGVSLRELVESLNALGIGPRDMISILQSIKAAGALQAEIEVM